MIRQNRDFRRRRPMQSYLTIRINIIFITFVGTIKQGSALVLASAVHFQNKWKKEFTQTKSAMFCLSAKEHIEIQMMHQTGHFKYFKDDINKFAALELPYQVYKLYELITVGYVLLIARRARARTHTHSEAVSRCWSYCPTKWTRLRIWRSGS